MGVQFTNNALKACDRSNDMAFGKTPARLSQSPHQQLDALHSTLGNKAVGRLMQQSVAVSPEYEAIQAKPQIGNSAGEITSIAHYAHSARLPLVREDGVFRYDHQVKAKPSEGLYSIKTLHQTFGNQAVGRLIRQAKINSHISGVIQAKLTINSPNDIYEQEADRVADQIMRMPDKGADYYKNDSTLRIPQFEIGNPHSAMQLKPG